jgi:hypothetical protein
MSHFSSFFFFYFDKQICLGAVGIQFPPPPHVSTDGKETLRLIRDNSRDTVISPSTLKALCRHLLRFFDELSELLRVGIKLITLHLVLKCTLLYSRVVGYTSV